MAKAIIGWEGGIQFRVQYAARQDGVVFKRMQSKGAYGYKWSPWRYANMKVSLTQYPTCITQGFSNAYLADPVYSTFKNWRLPAD